MPVPLFITPTTLEGAAVRKALGPALAAGLVRLELCGVGEQNAAGFCKQLNSERTSSLVLLGLAGGLIPGLPVGKVIIASSVLRTGKPEIACFPLEIDDSLNGSILTSPVALLTPTQKQAASNDGAIARTVYVEEGTLAAWALENNLPFIHGRVILDPLEETLPDTGSFLDSSGKVHWKLLLNLAIRHPGLVISLIRVYSRARALDPVLGNLALNCLQATKENSRLIQSN